jgi:hypothetical protein
MKNHARQVCKQVMKKMAAPTFRRARSSIDFAVSPKGYESQNAYRAGAAFGIFNKLWTLLKDHASG